MQPIADELYPEAERIVIVMDNLNRHDVSSLYKRFEIHFTLKRLYPKIEKR